MDKIFLNDEYDRILEKIKNKDNFVLLRYGDGERNIIEGTRVRAQEGWISPNKKTLFSEELKKSLLLKDNNVYYGISCPCCDKHSYYYYSSRIANKNITFANIFVNSNYKRFKKDFCNIKRDAIIIANKDGESNKIGNLNVIKYYSVSNDCIDFYNNYINEFVERIIRETKELQNVLYVLSAGPLSEIIIMRLFASNPNNTYIDFGSSIDFLIHKKDTRPYTRQNSEYANRTCYMFDPKKVNFDVSVVLTSYKKPESLKKQLDAIENQTLKAKEIYLFQDGIEFDYKIVFSKTILSRFSSTNINKINHGVWERFSYSQSVHSQYVCIFDDDTIPGTSWLENCHFSCLEKNGIYCAIGILLTKPYNYPFKNFFKVGWLRPNFKIQEVDFGGHSWFMESKILKYINDNKNSHSEYKYVGEDMCLSFSAKKKGIGTYVPKHNIFKQEEWGSLPEHAIAFGRLPVSISMSSDNAKNMNNAICSYKQDNINFVYKTKSKISIILLNIRLSLNRIIYYLYRIYQICKKPNK